MMRVAMTANEGFLAWHTRCALRVHGGEVSTIEVGERYDLAVATAAMENVDRVIHIAAAIRGSERDALQDDLRIAAQLSQALRETEQPPRIVVFANTTRSGDNTAYGSAKAQAADSLAAAAERIGAEFLDVRLPSLFGEHSRPFEHAVTATFSHILARGGEPTIDTDRELTLIHAQNAADLLIGAVPSQDQAALEQHETITSLLDRLREFSRTYRFGEIPDLTSFFDRDLFNTYRSHVFPDHALIRLEQRRSERGSSVEVLRSQGGPAQLTFLSIAPGATRGNHFHRRKLARLTSLSGSGTIALRKLFSDKVIEFTAVGDEPIAIDLPTLWAHKITNTGEDSLIAASWTNEISDERATDTVTEPV